MSPEWLHRAWDEKQQPPYQTARPKIPALERPGWIYFVGDDGDSPIKVGWATDVEKRLEHLQIGQWADLRCFGRVPGTQQDEADAHDRLRQHRIRGEWFQRAAALELLEDLKTSAKPKLRRVQ